MAKKKEQVAKKTAKLDDKQLDKVQGGVIQKASMKAAVWIGKCGAILAKQ